MHGFERLLWCFLLLSVPAAMALAADEAASPSADDPASLRFAITRYEVSDGDPLSPREIETALAPFIGPDREFADLQRAAAVLEAEYRKRGFVTVRVILPEQTVDGGVVKLEVVRAVIGKVTITGNRRFSEENIRRSLPALREGVAPNVVAISAASQVANQSPAKEVRVILKPTADAARVDADVEVLREQRPFRAFLTLDNTGTTQTGRDRFGVGLQHANLFDRDHIGTFQYVTSIEKPEQVSIASLGYRIPFYSLQDSVDVFLGYSDVDSGQTTTPAGPLAVSGRGTIGGARYNLTLPRRGEYEQRVILGIDYRLFDSVCSLGNFGAQGCVTAGLSPGKVAVHPWSIGYAGTWSPTGRRFDMYVTYARNFAGGAHGGDADFRAVQTNTAADFGVLRYGGSFATAFGPDWQFRFAVNGQRATDPLISAERFGLGGYNSVRGFLERELLGDRGLSGTVELYTPDIAARLGWGRFTARLLAFYDAGAARTNQPLPGVAEHISIGSAGIGLRAGFTRDVSLRFDAAQVVDAGGQQRRGDVMLHAGIVALF